MDVGGAQVPVLDVAGRALIVALHAAAHGIERSKTVTDLQRALERASLEDWETAASLARQLDAAEGFSAGLRLVPSGKELADTLGLPSTFSPKVTLRATSAGVPSLAFEQFATLRGLGPRVRYAALRLFPPPGYIRFWAASATGQAEDAGYGVRIPTDVDRADDRSGSRRVAEGATGRAEQPAEQPLTVARFLAVLARDDAAEVRVDRGRPDRGGADLRRRDRAAAPDPASDGSRVVTGRHRRVGAVGAGDGRDPGDAALDAGRLRGDRRAGGGTQRLPERSDDPLLPGFRRRAPWPVVRRDRPSRVEAPARAAPFRPAHDAHGHRRLGDAGDDCRAQNRIGHVPDRRPVGDRDTTVARDHSRGCRQRSRAHGTRVAGVGQEPAPRPGAGRQQQGGHGHRDRFPRRAQACEGPRPRVRTRRDLRLRPRTSTTTLKYS